MSNFIVGLTGGIGSGKTTVSDMFAKLSVDIIDADIVAREVVAPKSKALAAIKNYFGADFINKDGSLNRTKLRTHIFENPSDKHWLNELLHPIIRQEITAQLASSQSQYSILVAPLLLENGLDKLVNRVLVVDINEQAQVNRTTARDPSSAEEVKKIINSQMLRKDRLNLADDVIDNHDANLDLLKQQVCSFHQKYLDISSN